MKKELCYQILGFLIEREKYISASVLSEQFNVSTKTIRNYLASKEFLSLIYPCEIDKKPNLGVKLIGSKDEIIKIKRILFIENYDFKKSLITKNDDINEILIILFQSKGSSSYNLLANELYKNRNALKGDIKIVKKFFEEFNVEVNVKEHLGIWIDGEEKNIRRAYRKFILDYISEEKDEENQAFIKVDDKLIKAIQGLFQKINIRNVMNMIFYSEKMLGYKFTDIDKVQLTIRLTVLIQRALIDKKLFNNQDDLKNTKEYFTAEIIRMQIEKEYPIILNESEVLEIAEYLLSCRSQKQYMQQDEHFNISIAKQFLSKVGDFLEIDLTKDEILLSNLIIHLKPAIRRLKYGVKSENPIVKDIRYEYSDIYLSVLTSIEEIERIENVAFDINEIGYICLHIVAAINRKEKGRYIRTCLICDSGLTIVKYLESAITANVQELLLVETITSEEVAENIFYKYDLILDSTSTVNSGHYNVLPINNIFYKNDASLIHHWILNRQVSCNKNNSVFSNTVLLFKEDNITQEEILKKYSSYLEKNKYVDEGFVQSVFEREKRASTLIGKGVAVPHGYRNYVKKSVMIIIKLSEKIQWGDEPVDMVFLLAMNFENEEENKKIFRNLYQIIADDEKLHCLKTAKNLEAIKSMFSEGINKEEKNLEIQEIVNIENIDLNLEVNNKNEAFKKIAEMFYKNNVIESVDDYVKAVIEREKEFSTGIGFGLAIPHAKCKTVKKASIAVARLSNPIEYASIDDEPIKTIFMIAVPEQGAEDHIKILSNLSRRFMHEDFRERLSSAKSPEEIINILK